MVNGFRVNGFLGGCFQMMFCKWKTIGRVIGFLFGEKFSILFENKKKSPSQTKKGFLAVNNFV
jgi:hypothetical protein